VADEQENEACGKDMEKVVGEVIAERFFAPKERVEHEGGDRDGAVEIQHVHFHDAESKGGEKVGGIVNEVPAKDFLEGIVSKTRTERVSEDREYDK
jgi:general stress protein YciG